jgi:GNAT superfamily N-acetyltransferase
VPEALIAFLESTDYIDALRKAIGLGGDSDTLACIAGAVAEAHYRVLPDALLVPGCARLPDDLLQVSAKFAQCHPELPVRLAPGQACPGDGVTDAVVLLAGAARRAEVGELFAAYREALGPSVCVRDFDAELATLPGRYAEPGGALLLAVGNDGPLGCAGVRPAGGDTAELKRLYVLPRARGRGAGRRLLDAALAWTRQAGYQGIVLETLPSMRVARRLYLARGFRRVDEPVVAGGAAERYRLVFAQHLQPATPDP